MVGCRLLRGIVEQPGIEVGGADAEAAAAPALAADATGAQRAGVDRAADRSLAAADSLRGLGDGQVLERSARRSHCAGEGKLQLRRHVPRSAKPAAIREPMTRHDPKRPTGSGLRTQYGPSSAPP